MLPPLPAFLGNMLMAVLTVSGTFFDRSSEVVGARGDHADRSAELNGTKIKLVSATHSGDVATLTFHDDIVYAFRGDSTATFWKYPPPVYDP